jgi:isopenicillin-N N-acyltransferase like protein
MPILSHVSTETDPYERGRAFGLSRDVPAAFDGYAKLFQDVGVSPDQVREWSERALRETMAWSRPLAEEMIGIADGSGLDPWQVGALNSRTEILAAAAVGGEGECSTSVIFDGEPRTVQTWDWHDTLREGMLVWSLEPRPGHQVHTFTEVGVVGKIGVNSAGLGVHFNVLRHNSDHAEIGVPVHAVARRILDEASTVDEATELAKSARLSASTVITVVSAGGARGLELCPERVAELELDEAGFLFHTNHFLDPKLAEGERSVPEESTTYDRLPGLRARLAQLSVADRTQRAHALRSHKEDGAALCAHPDHALPPHQRWESLATISLDVVTPRLFVHEGGPCRVESATWQAYPAEN